MCPRSGDKASQAIDAPQRIRKERDIEEAICGYHDDLPALSGMWTDGV